MRIGELASRLKAIYYWDTGFAEPPPPVLLLGGQGIGKTTVIIQTAAEIAAEMGLEFVEYEEIHGKHILENPGRYFVFVPLPLEGIDPVDLTGSLRQSGEESIYLPPRWAKIMHYCRGIIFIDDFLDTQRPEILHAAYKILGDHRVGNVKLNPHAWVVAASNTAKYSSLSGSLPAPLTNRLLILEVLPPTPDEWRDWMDMNYKDRWDRRVYAFLKMTEGTKEDMMFVPPPETETLEPHPTPRSWTRLARALYLGKATREEMIGLIGPVAATRFISFITTSVDIESLLNNPNLFSKLDTNGKYVVVVALASKYHDDARFNRLLVYIGRTDTEFLVLFVHMLPMEKRMKFINRLRTVDADLYDDILNMLKLKVRL